jgi:AraC-like DNA-binding protein
LEHILLIVSIFGLLLTTLFLSKRDGFTDSTRFLAIFYFIISLYCFQTWVIESKRLLEWQWFYAWPLPIYALMAPALYFYFLSIIKDQFKWSWRYTILFIPWLLASIDVCMLYAKPQEVYDQIIQEAISRPVDRFESQYGIFSLKWHFLFRNLWILAVLIFLFLRLKAFFGRKSSVSSYVKTYDWLKLLYILVFALTLFSVYLGILSILNLRTSQILVPAVLMFVFYGLVLILGVTPLYFPSILYGLPQLKTQQLSQIDPRDEFIKRNTDIDIDEGGRYGLDETVILEQLARIENDEKYLLADFNLDRLAFELDMPVHHVSYFLNHHFGLSYSEYRNRLRMQKACDLIRAGFFQQNTIEALAWKCGYASRSAFTKTFKAFTGMNPSEFV